MKIPYLLVVLALPGLAGCSTAPPGNAAPRAGADPETVLVTYHVKPGNEAEFEKTLSRAWQIYRTERLVFARPHLVVRDKEKGGKPRFVEIFTWVNRSIPEHAPESVRAIWKEEESLCEQRDGQYGIEPGEVQLVVPGD